MIKKNVVVKNKLGLHARPAAMIVKFASKFSSEIVLIRNNVEVNAKSILGVMMLAAGPGTVITVQADGPDEKDAMDAICSLFDKKFEEE